VQQARKSHSTNLLNRALLVVLAVVAAVLSAGAAFAERPTHSPVHFKLDTAQALPGLPYSVYVPASAPAAGPRQVVVALHGMGGDGPTFAASLLARAEQLGFVVVAPTMPYSANWRDPESARRDDAALLPRLKSLIDNLPADTGLQINPKVKLYGFSRGAQMAHRFASFYPRSVRSVAMYSAGTYTLPKVSGQVAPGLPSGVAGLVLSFPFGLADLDRYTGQPFDPPAFRQVRFLVGVGAGDSRVEDVPREWDSYCGKTRVERATSYYQALTDLGVDARLDVVAGVGHQESPEMRARAMSFLSE
jgi:predicted esterase